MTEKKVIRFSQEQRKNLKIFFEKLAKDVEGKQWDELSFEEKRFWRFVEKKGKEVDNSFD